MTDFLYFLYSSFLFTAYCGRPKTLIDVLASALCVYVFVVVLHYLQCVCVCMSFFVPTLITHFIRSDP